MVQIFLKIYICLGFNLKIILSKLKRKVELLYMLDERKLLEDTFFKEK